MPQATPTGVHRTVDEILNHFEMWVAAIQGNYKKPKSCLNPEEAKQALLKDLLEIIGEDEPMPIKSEVSQVDRRLVYPKGAAPSSIKARNQLKAELREKIRGYLA